MGIAILVLAAGLLAWWWFSQENQYNWSERYYTQEKEPYDAYVLFEQLKNSQKENFHEITDTIYRKIELGEVPPSSNLVFVGNEMFLDSAETRFVLDFVGKGNNALIACDYFPENLLDSLFHPGETYDYYYDEHSQEYSADFKALSTYSDSVIHVGFLRDELNIPPVTCQYIVNFKPYANNWQYFRSNLYTPQNVYVEELGAFNTDIVNFIRVPWGTGNFYLHSTPLLFTNYHLLNDTINDYALKVFSVLGDGPIYWDEKDRYWDPVDYKSYPHESPERGPLAFILSEPALRTAWYLLIAGSLLYLLFGAKRKQRIIPVIENMDNTSIEYAEVISQLFMKEKDHKKLVLLKMDLFRAFLRERLMIRTPPDPRDENEELFQLIAVKSNVPLELVSKIFTRYKALEVIEGVDTPTMLEFYSLLEEFYTRCK